MKRMVALVSCVVGIAGGAGAVASPEDDLKGIHAYFQERFPGVPIAEYKNGIYAIDADRRAAWEEFEAFSPPYEEAVELGKQLFSTPFANGKTYASCFPNGGIGVRQNYPMFDPETGTIKTLEGEINACREKNGEQPLKWKTGDIAAISAYMGFTSRGNKINIVIPDDPRALALYERGKKHFYAKRGQLNFACADCHVYNAGNHVRADMLSPVLGHVTHFPVWRKKWAVAAEGPTGGLGTLHRRYEGCNKQVRATPFKVQGDEYRALEYFHTYLSNGLEVNAPSLRQ